MKLLDRQKFNYEDYKISRTKPISFPDPDNRFDDGHYTKYSHNVPPPEAYFILPRRWNDVCTEENPNARFVFYGWNNITEFEKRQMQLLRDECASLEYPIPDNFGERDVLKFAQGDKFNIPKAAASLIAHLKWRASLPPRIEITPLILRLIHSGCFYLHGRDKFYRPCFVQDCGKIA